MLDLHFFRLSDDNMCELCSRLKITRHSFNKNSKFRENLHGDYVSVDITVFVNYPSRAGRKYVKEFTNHATKRSRVVYAMKKWCEFIKHLEEFNLVK